MKNLAEILTTEELAAFLKFPKLIPHLVVELPSLTIKQLFETSNLLGLSELSLILRIEEELK